ncbi:MAG: tetratricopeptide repeat protein [Saprospiraceae bacterium]
MSTEFGKDILTRQLDQAILDHPFVDSLYYLRATNSYQKGDFKSAQADLVYAIKLDSLSPDYYHLLADAYLDNNDSYQGLSTMYRAAKQFPDRIPTLLKLSEFQNILKQNDQSLETINSILKVDPINANAYLMAGINLRDLKDTVNAIKNLLKATRYDDQLVDSWIILGQLTRKSDFNIANAYFENAMRIDSEGINTLHNYAEFLQDTLPLSAIRLYKKIIDIDHKYQDAYLNAGILYFKLDSFSQALSHFNILTQLEPAEPKFYYYRGTIKEAMADKKGARLDFEQALHLKPDFTEASKAMKSLK